MDVGLYDTDMDIWKYIKRTPRENYDDILKSDHRWPVFYHLSVLRESILNWYEFKKDLSLLEVGGGMGALTGLFCDRCRQVTVVEKIPLRADGIRERYKDKKNLEVITGDICSVNIDERFDYITAIGILDTQQNPLGFLRMLAKLLKPGGKLLIAAENRFGIKYWCGEKEKHTGLPFEGIRGGRGYFGKKELKDIISEAGFEGAKFYYPMPDYILPQLIYSENLLPERDIRTRIVPYYIDSSSFLASEKDIYNDIIENGAFEFMANSFLVECSSRHNFCSVIYAAVTADRPPKYRFATVVTDKGIALKIPLDIRGMETARFINQNLGEIADKGIPIVESEIKDGALIMPRYECDSVEKHLVMKLKNGDIQAASELLDKVYEYVLQSSERIDAKENALYSKYSDIDFGPVLRKVYMDMVPINCFYKNGEFIFFDQEFVKYNFPAKYVMFRALYLTFINAGESFPLEHFKKRYKLEGLWDIFKSEEERFVDSVRNRELYAAFYKWAALDYNSFEYNSRRLLGI